MTILIENYLTQLQEKEWDEKDIWKAHLDADLLKHLISKNSETGEQELNVNRHSIQPVLMNLIKNTGGDYKGRKTSSNSDHGDFSGVEYILKRLPSDWEDKLRKHVEKIAKKHNEE